MQRRETLPAPPHPPGLIFRRCDRRRPITKQARSAAKPLERAPHGLAGGTAGADRTRSHGSRMFIARSRMRGGACCAQRDGRRERTRSCRERIGRDRERCGGECTRTNSRRMLNDRAALPIASSRERSNDVCTAKGVVVKASTAARARAGNAVLACACRVSLNSRQDLRRDDL